MSDVNETLQELMERRLREMGQRRGRGESISLREAWMRLPEDDAGHRPVSYETVRRIREQGHSNIGGATAAALATMLDVRLGDVQSAAGQRPDLGPFQLPPRADRLLPAEREAVLAVVDAILNAAGGAPDRRTETRRGSSADRTQLRAVAQGGDPEDDALVDELARRERRKQTDGD